MFRTCIILPFLLSACAGDDTGSDANCLDTEVLTALDVHAEALRFSAAMLAGHPGAREAIGFFTFPGLEVQRAAVYAGPLVMKCSEALLYDQYCEKDGLCSQIECTGEGASWEMHFWLDAPTEAEIRYESATIYTAWVEGETGISFAIASQAASDRDWSLSGSGTMDVEAVEVTEEYDGLVEGSVVALTISDDSVGNHDGTITVDGEVVAEPNAEGAYTAVDACR